MIKNIGIIGGSGKIGTTFKKAFEKVGLNVMVTDDSSIIKPKIKKMISSINLNGSYCVFQ